MWRWSNAATSLMCRDSNIPLPNTSPDMSPMPTMVRGAVSASTSSERKCACTDTHAPRDVIAISLWSNPTEPPDANASPSQ